MLNKTYLLALGVGHLSALLACDWLADYQFVNGAVHGVRHPGGGCVLIVKITDRRVFTHHLGYCHRYLNCVT